MLQKSTPSWLGSWLKTIAQDLVPLWILITFSVCIAFAVNQFREHPLPLVYASKAERLQHEVEGILSRENAQSAQVAGTSQNASQTGSTMADVSETVEGKTASGEVSTDLQEPQFLDLEATRSIVKGEKPGLILDARPEIFHRLGHIPRAVSLPRENFETAWQQLRERVEKNKPHPLVIYCSGANCEDSLMVAAALQKLGLPNVRVFKGGWGDWTAAKLPEETAP